MLISWLLHKGWRRITVVLRELTIDSTSGMPYYMKWNFKQWLDVQFHVRCSREVLSKSSWDLPCTLKEMAHIMRVSRTICANLLTAPVIGRSVFMAIFHKTTVHATRKLLHDMQLDILQRLDVSVHIRSSREVLSKSSWDLPHEVK